MQTITLGKSCSPSKMISNQNYRALKMIVQRGQTTDTYFVREKDFNLELFNDVLVYNIKTLCGRIFTINASYVISTEQVTIVEIKTNASEWANYPDRLRARGNKRSQQVDTICYVIHDDTQYKVVDYDITQRKVEIAHKDTYVTDKT